MRLSEASRNIRSAVRKLLDLGILARYIRDNMMALLHLGPLLEGNDEPA